MTILDGVIPPGGLHEFCVEGHVDLGPTPVNLHTIKAVALQAPDVALIILQNLLLLLQPPPPQAEEIMHQSSSPDTTPLNRLIEYPRSYHNRLHRLRHQPHHPGNRNLEVANRRSHRRQLGDRLHLDDCLRDRLDDRCYVGKRTTMPIDNQTERKLISARTTV